MQLAFVFIFCTLVCLLTPPAKPQAIDTDKIDYTIMPGYTNLRGCVIWCFGWRTQDAVGCYTNACLCRPSTLYTALQSFRACATEGCQNLDDVNEGTTVIKDYCIRKGYTSGIGTPTVLPSTLSGTATVTVYSTVRTSKAARPPVDKDPYRIVFATAIILLLSFTVFAG